MTIAALRTHLTRQVGPLLPIAGAVAVGFGVCGLIALWVGLSPTLMFSELIKGAVEGPQLFETVARAVPLVGMTLAAAVPLRAGIVNLGADGQLVLGGCTAAIVALYLPAPNFARLAMALTSGMVVGAAYAAAGRRRRNLCGRAVAPLHLAAHLSREGCVRLLGADLVARSVDGVALDGAHRSGCSTRVVDSRHSDQPRILADRGGGRSPSSSSIAARPSASNSGCGDSTNASPATAASP